MPDHGLAVEDHAEALRLFQRMAPGSIESEYFIEGKTMSEIGDVMGVSESRVCQKLHAWRSQWFDVEVLF